MTIEDQIRNALRADAGSAEARADGWDDVRDRAEARTRRQRAIRYPVAGLVAAAAIAAIVVGIAALRSTSESEPSIATPSGVAMPEQIVAIVDDPAWEPSSTGSRLVVLDSETGAEVRTLAEGVEGPLSVDDTYVYFEHPGDQACDGPTSEIVRAPTAGGPAEVISLGLYPQVSPDGRFLAYAGFQPGAIRECATPPRLIIRDLASGAERPFSVPDDQNVQRFPLVVGWSPDSRSLLYAVNRGTETVDARFGLKYFLLHGDAKSGALDESNSTPVQLPDGTVHAFGITADGLVLVSKSSAGNRYPSHDEYELAFVDAAKDGVTRSIVSTGEFDVYDAALDPSGRHIVYANFSTPPQVERITIGADEAASLEAESIYTAWVPAASSRGPVDGRWVISVGEQPTPPKVDAPPPTVAEQVPPGAETAALAEALLRMLPKGWTLEGTSESVPSDGSTVRGAAFDAPDGIGRLSATWQDLVQPMAILPEGNLDRFGSYEQTPEGEFVTINHAAPEAEVTLVRPNGHRLSLRYGPRYTQEHTREQVEASGGPPSALDAGELRSIATQNVQ